MAGSPGEWSMPAQDWKGRPQSRYYAWEARLGIHLTPKMGRKGELQQPKAWRCRELNESNQLTHAKLCQIGFWSEPITANRLRREQGIGFVGAWVSWYPASSGRSQLCWNIARFRWQMWTVPIMWPSCGHGLKKRPPTYKILLFSRTHLQHRARISIHAYTFFKR